MSITLDQNMCDHSFDNTFYCKKCGYTDLHKRMMSQVTFEIPELTDDNNKVYVDYISDVHLDFWIREMNPQSPKFERQIKRFIKEVLKPKTSNILILAGDQGHYFNQDKGFLLELKKHYNHILIVPGNHDMYLLGNRQRYRYQNNSNNRILEMKQLCRDIEGLHFLDGKVIVINGISFGGLGMWHDESYGKSLGYDSDTIYMEWKNIMNDAVNIMVDGKENYSIPTAYGGSINHTHFDYRILFKKYRDKLDKMEPCDIMISHYGPRVPDALPEDYKDISTSFYYFDGLKDIERLAPKYWIHGHTHGRYNEVYKDTNIICNPLGYPDENTYNEILTLEI